MRKMTAILLTAFLSITLASCSDKPAKTAISEIILSSNSVEVQMGESIQLSVSILPSSAELPELSWSSSNSAIATVDGTGCVTGISVGQTNVIVEGENNTYTTPAQAAYGILLFQLKTKWEDIARKISSCMKTVIL